MQESQSNTLPGHLIELALDTPDGPLHARVAVPAGPMRLAELAFNALGLDQRLVGMAERREAREGRSISCRKGCGACCRQLVPVSPPEAWMIADVLASIPEPRRRVLLERFGETAKRLETEGFRERLMKRPESEAEVRALARDYFYLGLACPFLEKESCSIHAVRPAICREYLVTSPAEWCANPFEGAIKRVAVSICLSQALARLAAELLGGETQLIPLALAPAWAAEHVAQGRREFEGRTMLERLLQLLSEK
jgi:Fe-S-cluster containining protein